ncbi:MAG TPA: KH domain-containing protein [Acidimicrobiales bacterium]|nr:KH domain-containing protein [Acidimicrobiales bacterium]
MTDADTDTTESDEVAPTAVAVLEHLVKALVDAPDAVRVDVDDSHRHKVRLDVHVAEGDMGRVIGRRGRVAMSIRTVVRAAAVRDGVEVDVEFVD